MTVDAKHSIAGIKLPLQSSKGGYTFRLNVLICHLQVYEYNHDISWMKKLGQPERMGKNEYNPETRAMRAYAPKFLLLVKKSIPTHLNKILQEIAILF